MEFQFLIGWLQTYRLILMLFLVMRIVSIPYRLATNQDCQEFLQVQDIIVSIPYRLATNNYKWKRTPHTITSFNSLQVGYKPGSASFFIPTVVGFNSLQVGYKQKQASEKRPTSCTVSIPYRLATNPYQRQGKAQNKGFQFLIGWLQTEVKND